MTEALVNRRLLAWARERHNFSTQDVAKKIAVSGDTVKAWEQGKSRPTFRQAYFLAEKLHIPFGYLYLSEPPKESFSLPDLRTKLDRSRRPPSPEFSDLLDDALRKQDWFREYQELEGSTPLAFIGKFRGTQDVKAVAKDIRSTLGIDARMREEANSWEQFLIAFIRRAESRGILVLRSGVVGRNTHRPLDVDEFRGFVISDTLAPLVFINSKDWKSAQIFTLTHELAHLWIGESGVLNPDYLKSPSEQAHPTERFCDHVAAETLVPEADFVLGWQEGQPTEQNLQLLASKFRVSAFVVLRKALDLGAVQEAEYESLHDYLRERTRPASGSGGDFYSNFLARNSSTLTKVLLIATAEGRLPRREAAMLLDVSLGTLPSIERHLGF